MPRSSRSAGSPGLGGAETTLRAHAMAKPEATEHFPWGERAIKVKGKVFLFMYADKTRLSLSTKLPRSRPGISLWSGVAGSRLVASSSRSPSGR